MFLAQYLDLTSFLALAKLNPVTLVLHAVAESHLWSFRVIIVSSLSSLSQGLSLCHWVMIFSPLSTLSQFLIRIDNHFSHVIHFTQWLCSIWCLRVRPTHSSHVMLEAVAEPHCLSFFSFYFFMTLFLSAPVSLPFSVNCPLPNDELMPSSVCSCMQKEQLWSMCVTVCRPSRSIRLSRMS